MLLFNDYLLLISFASFFLYIIIMLLMKEKGLIIKLKLLLISIVIINLFNSFIDLFIINFLLFSITLIILWVSKHYFIDVYALKSDLVISEESIKEKEVINSKLIDKKSIFTNLPDYILLFNILVYVLIFSSTPFMFETNLQSLNYNLNFSNLIFIILILSFSLFLHKISKIEFSKNKSNVLLSSLILFIVLGLINIIISNNLVSVISWFISSAVFLGFIFFLDDFSKEYKLINPIFNLIIISIGIFVFTFIMILIFGGINVFSYFNISAIFSLQNNLIIGLLIFGFALLGSVIPFSLKKFKIFFQDNSLTGLFLYSIFLFNTTFFIFKLGLTLSSDFLIIFIILFIFPMINVCLSLLYICLELFSSHEGFSHSFKKTYGYYIIAVFNLVLLLLSFSIYIPSIEFNSYMSNLLLFIYKTIIITLLIIYLLIPLISTFEDNIQLIGVFYFRYKLYNILFIIPGIIMIFFVGYPYMYSLLLLFTKNPINSNFVLSVNLAIILTIFIILILIFIIIISAIYVNLLPYRKEVYNKLTKEYKLNLIDLILIIIIISIIFLISIINIVNL